MPKYLCIQRSTEGTACEEPSPTQMEEMYAVFNSWREKFQQNIVDLDEEKKATMVNNLLVVLTSERDSQPVVNAGSIY